MMFLLPCLPSLTPSIPLSHYVLLFHITAKQFEAPKGSPFPSLPLTHLPPMDTRFVLWPTWRVQYILRSYKLSKHRPGRPWPADWPTPLEGKEGELTPARLHPCSKVAGAAGIQKRVLISRNWEHHLAQPSSKCQCGEMAPGEFIPIYSVKISSPWES